MKEHIRTWQDGIFRLELFDTNQRDTYGKWILGYEFYCEDTLVFEGEDFCCSPCHSVDSNRTVASLLTFLALRPGDTDREYFDTYTEQQMDFAMEHGEMLWMCAWELEQTDEDGEPINPHSHTG